jgi:serine/threonine protein phosphatase PrpC
MRCGSCGAEVREGARFCNVCGAQQPAPRPINVPQASVPPLPVAVSSPDNRAPRNTRTDLGGDSAAAITTKMPPAVPVSPPASDSPAFSLPPEERPHTTIGTLGSTSPVDGEPWPLPSAMIVGGRYRVEAVLAVSADPAGENEYRVTDLKGYLKCWSCGAEHEETSTAERYCPECDADMLSRGWTMRERVTTEAERASGEDSAKLAQQVGAAPEEIIFHRGVRVYRVAPESTAGALFPGGTRLIAAAATDIGLSRSVGENEDSVGHIILEMMNGATREPLALGVVADGLGGHASGREASTTVVRTLIDFVLRQVALPQLGTMTEAPATEEGLRHVLSEGILAANNALAEANRAGQKDSGSTVVAALISSGEAHIANIGDSRAYVLDEQGLRRITTDHSFVEQLIAGGLIQPEERYTHPQRNQIFRSLGTPGEPQIDFFTQQLRPGMRLLLCSDGLWEMVRDEEITNILTTHSDPQGACDALIAAANDHGGDDNISAVVIAVEA